MSQSLISEGTESIFEYNVRSQLSVVWSINKPPDLYMNKRKKKSASLLWMGEGDQQAAGFVHEQGEEK